MVKAALLATLTTLFLVAPIALAGSETNPEVKDPAGDANPAPSNNYGDVVAIWFTEDAKGLKGHEKLTSVTTNPPTMTFYQMFFATTGCNQYFLFAYLNGTTPEGFYGSFDSCNNSVGEQVPSQALSWPTGDRPIFEMTMPREYLNGTFKGDAISKTGGNSGNGACGFAFIAGPQAGNAACTNPAVPFEYDHAGPGADYVLTTGQERPGAEVQSNETDEEDPDLDDGTAAQTNASTDESTGDPPAGPANTPGFEVVAGVAALAAVAFGRRRHPSG